MDRTYGVSDTIVAVRHTSTGLVYNRACKLHWISCNPDAGNSEWQISDSAIGGATPLLGHFHTSKEGHLDIIIPPCPFANGIWIEKFDKMASLTFGYSVA